MCMFQENRRDRKWNRTVIRKISSRIQSEFEQSLKEITKSNAELEGCDLSVHLSLDRVQDGERELQTWGWGRLSFSKVLLFSEGFWECGHLPTERMIGGRDKFEAGLMGLVNNSLSTYILHLHTCHCPRPSENLKTNSFSSLFVLDEEEELKQNSSNSVHVRSTLLLETHGSWLPLPALNGVSWDVGEIPSKLFPQ